MKIWLIEARTGCTCCRSDNFKCGPFKSEDEALECAANFERIKRLASQYAPNGVYDIEEHEAEEISGGRYIIDDRIWGPHYKEIFNWGTVA